MNRSKYNKSRLRNILAGLFPAFLSYFLPRDKSYVIFNSFHNVKFDENTKEFFLYLLKNTNLKVAYVMNDDDYRKKLIEEYGDYFVETKTFKGIMNVLKAHTWFINSFDLPIGGVFLKFRRNVIHLQHGVPIKNYGLVEKDLSFIKRLYYALVHTNVTHTVATTETFVEAVKNITGLKKDKNILVCGYPRFDLVNKMKNEPKNDNIIRILYAPTWRHSADVRIFPFDDLDMNTLDDFCKSKNIEIHIRIHPLFRDKISEELFSYDCIKDCSGDVVPDINTEMYKFDMLITDYSSIIYDFYLLNCPVFFFDYDRDEYEKNIGFAADYDTFAVGYRSHTMKAFFADIEDALTTDKYKEKREKICRLANGDSDNNSRDLYNLLCEKKILC